MTINQMAQALKDVGACFAVTTAKTILPNDPMGSKSSYHIHPHADYPHQDSIVRLYSQRQFAEYIRARRAEQRATSVEAQIDIMDDFWARWS